MEKILIVSKIIIGIEPTLYGFNNEGRWFKKSFSERLANQLNTMCKENNLAYEVYPATEYYRNVQDFNEEYDLLLLSPYIVDRIALKSLDKNTYYILSIDEFEKGETSKIIEFLKNRSPE